MKPQKDVYVQLGEMRHHFDISLGFVVLVDHVVYSGFHSVWLEVQGKRADKFFGVGVVFASISDVEVLEAGPGEMRDVIKVDELSEGLLAAILGQICPRRIGCSGPARWFTLVQRHGTAHEW